MKNGFSIKKLLILMFTFSIFWALVMYMIDCSVPYLACIPHRISGEIWFQLISSWLLTLPSIGICAYALIQTKQYHDLDEERLRPQLLMESAEISMCMINWTGFEHWVHGKDGIGVRQWEEYQRYRQKHDWEQSVNGKANKSDNSDNLGYLDFKSNLILKGGESVSRIMVQQIAIQIGNCRYIMKVADEVKACKNECEVGTSIFFNRTYKNGQEEYHIIWQIDYKDIVFDKNEWGNLKPLQKLSWQKRDEEYTCIQNKFWGDMYNAIVDPEYDIARRDMEWQIIMSIEYGINRSRRNKMSASAEWKIQWDGENRKYVNDYTTRQRSQEGIISIG